MRMPSQILTLDSNVFVAALKEDEPDSEKCSYLLSKVPEKFLLSEPSIVYQEVCGTLARRVGDDVAEAAKEQLDMMIHPDLLTACDKNFCVSAYPLCSLYNVYAIDAMYLKVALECNAILVSLDKIQFIDRIKSKTQEIEAYHPSEFQY